MTRALRHLRDFMTPEQLKWLPSTLAVESCILLRQNKLDAAGVTIVVLQVFDSKGNWIGEVPQPDFIPGC